MKLTRSFGATLALAILSVSVSAALVSMTPFGWDNDELGHYWTARDIYEDGGLPAAREFPSVILPEPPYRAAGQFRYHALPPAYYALVAGLFHLQPGQVAGFPPGGLAARALSAAFFAFAVTCVFRTARILGGGRDKPAALAAAAVALIPQLASTGASVTADSFALASIALLAWATARAALAKWSLREAAFVAAAAALLVMSRPTALPYLLIPALPLAIYARGAPLQALARAAAVGAVAVAPNIWWILRNQRNLGEPFGAGTHLEYLALRGLPTLSDEFAMFKASEAGLAGFHELFLRTDWPARFHTRMWLTGRYDSAGILGILLALILATSLVAAVAAAAGKLQTSSGPLASAEVRILPVAVLLTIVVGGLFAAFDSYQYGVFVVGRFAAPGLALLLATTSALLCSSRSPKLGFVFTGAVAGLLAASHLVYWTGFLLPDLLGEVVPR